MKTRAFTLVELLVVIAIIVVLAGLLLPVFSTVQRSGNKSREISAGRQLAAAYSSAAADNDGALLPGYTVGGEAWDDLGRKVATPICDRYPWRLAKYLNYAIVGSLIVNEQAKIADRRNDQEMYNYMVSLAPTFGMNCILVGGDYHGTMAPNSPRALAKFGKFCITRVSEVEHPARQIVFASAHYIAGEETYLGYHTVEPPNLTATRWQGAYDESLPQSLGYLHLRYEGRAVAVMLDGHVEMLDEKQLRDMRRWSNQAAEADEPNYMLGAN